VSSFFIKHLSAVGLADHQRDQSAARPEIPRQDSLPTFSQVTCYPCRPCGVENGVHSPGHSATSALSRGRALSDREAFAKLSHELARQTACLCGDRASRLLSSRRSAERDGLTKVTRKLLTLPPRPARLLSAPITMDKLRHSCLIRSKGKLLWARSAVGEARPGQVRSGRARPD
jgi:hypothetical protein